MPYLDQITFEVGQEPVVALLRLQRGEVDIPGDGIPPAKFLEVTNDPAYKELIIEGGQLHTGYITMNVNMKPLDDVDVRQAINMAINKDRIVTHHQRPRRAGQSAAAAGMPGYDQDYKGYPFDPEGAKALLAKAGFADGFDTELYVYNTDPNPRIAQAIQQDLAAIGIKAEIKSLAQANVIAAGGEPDQAPMIWSGGMAWIADFPDPSNFYGPILGCDGAVKGGWNWSWYCNKDLDAKAAKADCHGRPGQGRRARARLWRDIFLSRHGRRAVGAGLQRTALHHALRPPGRRRRPVRRSGAHSRQLRLRVRERCTITTSHTIHRAHHHFGWDNSFVPVETVAPGTTLHFECLDSGSGHFKRESTVADVGRLDFSKVNPVTGPIFIDGAEPGDAIKITIEEFEPSGFGWTAIIPGFGLLADQFTDPGLTLWTYDPGSMAPAAFSSQAKVPLKPFAGTIGLAPGEKGLHSVVPPRRGRRQHGRPRHRQGGRSSTCRSKSPAGCSRSATPTPPRATARSAARPSKAP